MSPDHLEPHGRILRTRGPFTYLLILLCAFSSLVATASAIFVAVSISEQVDATAQRISNVQASRLASAQDTCLTIRTVIQHAYAPTPQHLTLPAIVVIGQKHEHATLLVTSSAPKNAAAKAVKADGLTNCIKHAKRQVSLQHRISHQTHSRSQGGH